jgi:hypothetical protein
MTPADAVAIVLFGVGLVLAVVVALWAVGRR